MLSIALFEPNIPQNCGTILRMADCFGLRVDIIEPCGFIFGGMHMKRAGMDYLNSVDYHLHANYANFIEYAKSNNKRIILATTKGSIKYTDFKYQTSDVILFGTESSGLPENIHKANLHKIYIPMQKDKRSLNLALSCGIIISEAIRQVPGL
ncbi:tRNA (cytidine(34)-2'-O)-methyltransferase [Candidatus Hepatincolaceae symbiont of Richtersius coronifer]